MIDKIMDFIGVVFMVAAMLALATALYLDVYHRGYIDGVNSPEAALEESVEVDEPEVKTLALLHRGD